MQSVKVGLVFWRVNSINAQNHKMRSVIRKVCAGAGASGDPVWDRMSGNHTVTEYEMSDKPYSQKSG